MREGSIAKPNDVPWRVRARWLRQVAADDALSGQALRVAVGLCCFFNEKTRKCWPSQAVISEAISLSARSIRDHMPLLRTRGHVHIQRRLRDTPIYTMMVGETERAWAERECARETARLAETRQSESGANPPV